MLDPTPQVASAYLGDNKSGASRPQRFLIDGIGHALVKFVQSPQGPRLVVNELIGYSLAAALGIDCPQGGVVAIDATLLPHGGKLELPETERFEACTFEAGLHFYSQYLDSATDRLVPADLRGLNMRNGGDFAGAVVLDLLLNNWDRGPANMNLLLHREGNMQHLKVIDFGHAFGGGGVWSIGNLSDPGLPPLTEPLPYAEALREYLTTIRNPERDFAPFVERLSQLDDTMLDGILTAIPNDWQLTASERSALLDYLSQRVRAIPDYLRERLKREVWWQ